MTCSGNRLTAGWRNFFRNGLVLAVFCFAGVTQLFATDQGWTISAGFEGGVPGSRAQSPNPDAFHDAAGDSRYILAPIRTGSQGGSVSITAGTTAFGNWGGGFDFPSDLSEGDEIWFRVNVYYPAGWDFSCSCTEGMKFMRIHTASSAGGNEGYLTALIKGGTTGGLIFANSEVDSAFWSNNSPVSTVARNLGDPVIRDRWYTYEIYIQFSSLENEGVFRIWQDESLIFEDLQTPTLRSPTSRSDLIWVYSYWNNGAPRTQTSYIDDIVITTITPDKTDTAGNPMIGIPDNGAELIFEDSFE